ncbi:MAG: hypothetical protein ABMB14_15880, partial [Myxococcota bacterium]
HPPGAARVSAGGMGGLFFVGHQSGGGVFVFDLGLDGGVAFVGGYFTARDDTSGLSFDAGTNRLYVWHGESNDLEIVRLSSQPTGSARALDTEYLFDWPGSDNIEGVAVFPVSDCGAHGLRRLALIEDDGYDESIRLFDDWPLCAP